MRYRSMYDETSFCDAYVTSIFNNVCETVNINLHNIS